MHSQPLVTIGIPLYNEQKYIASAIESVINQAYSRLSIIVADNCSADKSYSIAKVYADRDSRIRLFKHDINKGPRYNFQFVLDKADSKYFAWLGGHDELGVNFIKEAVSVLEKNENAILAYPGGITIDTNGKFICDMEDNYDTTGLGPSLGLLKILQNFQNGYVIHGIFRTDVLRKIPIKKVIGPDMFIVSIAATYGDIVRLPSIGFRRRQIKVESSEEQKTRHIEQGLFKESSNPFAKLYFQLAKEILLNTRLSFFEKVRVLKNAQRIFYARFTVSWKDIVLSFKMLFWLLPLTSA